ncbi:hypothetical protein I312_105094 [Cryptococcus bacillisporus CA1280]|uniref:uncharacterized protein n=1 Tax=Cryptococcus bacillisporus CA1280 TaxID=1296109 RepID=UPI0033684F63
MHPSPAKRPRRTSSPEPDTPMSQGPLRHPSPSRTLPPIQGAGPPPSHGGPSTWSSAWRGASRPSQGAEGSESPKMEEDEPAPSGTTGGGPSGAAPASSSSVVFTRDVNTRAPRSMMACVRCRRQKMKCDGPSKVPCRGCRQAGQQCIFEPRSRPKSISVIPSRPYYPGRPGSPASFYPSGPQPAPPITSRPMNQEYAFRPTTREMPPPPATSAISSFYPGQPPRRTPPPQSVSSAGPSGVYFQHHPPPPPAVHPPPFTVPVQRPPPSPSSSDARLRALERTIDSTLRPLAWVPSALSSLQQSVAELRAQVAPRRVLTVADTTWEHYRTRAWPLTPWLIGLRDGVGLPGMVVDFLGRRAEEVEKMAAGQGMGSTMGLEGEARREVGRLIGEGKEWGKEEMRALTVLATWTNDTIYAGLAVAHGRMMGLDRQRRTHDDWREWIYIVIMDNMCHIPDFLKPVTDEGLSAVWRDRLAELPSAEPAIRDRDAKLLAWLEYSELLADVFRFRMPPLSRDPEYQTPLEAREKRLFDPWREFGRQWEGWANAFGARADPILSLHYTYAVLFTVSPVYFADAAAWEELAASPDGQPLLERGREAAIGVIQSICSAEVGRTLPYSFALYRPLLGLAVFHLISLAASLPTISTVSSSMNVITMTLRQAYDVLNAQVPDREALPGPSAGIPGVGAGVVLPGGLLAEVVESGRVDVGKRWIGMDVGREAWRRIIG